ncbi:hypothetical protein LRP52_19130 [Photobacterium sp. ZSDE20]|nr:hypothetical protein [Photobacterium sp. ZSDE20]
MKRLVLLALVGSTTAMASGMDSMKYGTLVELSTGVCKNYSTPSINDRAKELKATIQLESGMVENGKQYAISEQKTFEKQGVPREQFCELFESEVKQGNY